MPRTLFSLVDCPGIKLHVWLYSWLLIESKIIKHSENYTVWSHYTVWYNKSEATSSKIERVLIKYKLLRSINYYSWEGRSSFEIDGRHTAWSAHFDRHSSTRLKTIRLTKIHLSPRLIYHQRASLSLPFCSREGCLYGGHPTQLQKGRERDARWW